MFPNFSRERIPGPAQSAALQRGGRNTGTGSEEAAPPGGQGQHYSNE